LKVFKKPKKNQYQRTSSPSCFENLKEPVMKELLMNWWFWQAGISFFREPWLQLLRTALICLFLFLITGTGDFILNSYLKFDVKVIECLILENHICISIMYLFMRYLFIIIVMGLFKILTFENCINMHQHDIQAKCLMIL
jgi:hypothetical protein